MDYIDLLVHGSQDLMITKYLWYSAIALTLYDYLLVFDDEIRYVWKGRKTWVSYFYILNRTLLIGYQFWSIYYISGPRKSKTMCFAGYYVEVLIAAFFLFSSDIFITLRICALTSKNKILMLYFGALVLARLASALAAPFIKPPIVPDVPPIPLEIFNFCGLFTDLKPTLAPNSIGTAFELSAFLVIVWYTYRYRVTLKFSALARAIVVEATVYFLAMIALQIYVQLSLSAMKGFGQQRSFLVYGLFNPILSLRFAVSLKRSADPGSRQEWQLAHFSSVKFADDSSLDPRASATQESVELDPLGPQTRGP